MDPQGHHITQLLQAWSEDDQHALDQFVPLVYDDLRRLAQHHMAWPNEEIGRSAE